MEATTIQATTERNLAERRLSAVVSAVREHETSVRRKPYPRRGDDLSLYRRVREILGDDR
jgi:hypothetical protein